MGLREVYNTIETRLHTIVDSNNVEKFKHYHTWNQQFKDLLGKPGANKDISIPFPAVFIEVVVDSIEEQGSFNQLWNCTLNLHIAHQLYNAMNGEFEQNWDVFDLVDDVHKKIQGYHPTQFNTFIGTGLKQDYDHGNLYHFIQTYKFNYQNTYDLNYIEYTGATLTISASTIDFSVNPRTIITR